MANEVIYKHPASNLILTQDFTDDLPSDIGLKSTGATLSTYALYASDGVGVTTSPSDVMTVTPVTATTSMIMTMTLSNGTEGEDYLLEARGKGNTSASLAVRVIEVRVRANRGFGNY